MDRVGGQKYHIAFPGATLRLWSLAILGALFLNFLLFGLMPGLVEQLPGRTQAPQKINVVNVIRIKKPKPPPAKAKPKPPPLKELKPLERIKKTARQPRPDKRKLTLPFAINSKLPSLGGDLALPPLAMLNLGLQGMRTTFAMGEIDHPLVPLAQAPPFYPLRARRNGIEGWVKVNFVVSTKGLVEKVSILSAEPENIFDKVVRRCISGWRFKPGTVDGVPVKTVVETTVRFNLESGR